MAPAHRRCRSARHRGPPGDRHYGRPAHRRHTTLTRPRTYQAAVAQLLERQRIPYRTVDLVPVCPSDGEACLGWHVNLSTGAPTPTYGWIACRHVRGRLPILAARPWAARARAADAARRAALAADDPTAGARGTGALGTARRSAAGGPLTASTARQGGGERGFSCVGMERRRSINSTGTRRMRRAASDLPPRVVRMLHPSAGLTPCLHFSSARC